MNNLSGTLHSMDKASLSALDRDVAAHVVVDQIRRDVALRLAVRAGRRRRRRGALHGLALWATALLGAGLSWLARRR